LAAVDERGPDTMNRLLLHGARFHDRRAVFESASGETPDWRADRHSIRIGLALREGLGVGEGDVVGLFLPLSVEWAIAERGVWGLGAASLPLWPEWSDSERSRVLGTFSPRVVVTAVEIPELLERGSVLDTPERASAFRATARRIPPETLASIEPDSVELSHAAWVRRVGELVAQDPPGRGSRRVLAGARPDLSARVALHAAWADGLTTTVFEPHWLRPATIC
jgi:acyl-CoA synthetase (AMP-forming)/AMP-acid ligase II